MHFTVPAAESSGEVNIPAENNNGDPFVGE
jgi:hypothetical protein